jgi:outer membrane receptor protein involved in Fe transport
VGLQPEKADTWTGGVVFQPQWEWANGASVSADYFNVNVKNVITQLGSQQIIDGCQLANNAAFCSRIGFVNGAPSTIVTGYINANRLKTDGVDIEFSYPVPMPSFVDGDVKLRVLATWLNSLVQTSTAASVDRAGQIIPKWTWNIDLAYTRERFKMNATVNAHSKVYYDKALIGPDDSRYSPTLANSINKNTFPSVAYLHLSTSYQVLATDESSMEVYGMISNVFNTHPPYGSRLSNGGTNGLYDFIGRTFKVGVRVAY